MVQKSHSDADDKECVMATLFSVCSRSDTLSLMIYKILGRIAENEVKIERMQREIERLSNERD
jgi:hypothetical protein